MLKIKRPFALSALAMILSGALILTTEKELFLSALIISAVTTTVLALKKSPYGKHALLFTAATVLSCLLSVIDLGTVLAEHSLEGKERQIKGTVYDYPTIRQEGEFYVILDDCTVDGIEINGKIKAYIPHTAQIDTGEILSVSPSYIFANTSEGIFRYHTLSSGISLIASSDFSVITKLGADEGYSLLDKIHDLKEAVSDRILKSTDPENAAVIISLITGEKELLSEETKVNLRISGVSHIFAISGMHLSIWTGIFFIIFRQRSKSSIIPNFAALVFVIFYCIFTGLSPSVLRAGIMLSAVFIARLIRKHADPLNSLGIAVCSLLAINPFLSGNVSFLLSSAATLALIAFLPEIKSFKASATKRFRYIKQKLKIIPDSILISLCVILMTFPICAVFFGYISLISPFASLIVTPLSEIIMILSIPTVIIPAGNFIGDSLSELTALCSDIIIRVNTFFADLGFAVLPADKSIALPWFIISAALVVIIRFIYKNKRKTLTAVLICTLVLSAMNAFSFSLHKNETKLYIPGGENNTFIAITGKYGVTSAVYGCGGSFSAYRRVSEFLNRNAVLKLDALIVPRDKTTECNNMIRMKDSFLPKSYIELMNENTTAASLSGSLWESANIYAESDTEFSAAALYIDEVKIVICSLPSSDFSTHDKIFRSADILIARSAIPDTLDTDNFGSIIVITDRDIPLPSNAISSRLTDIKITVEGDSYVID